MHPDIEKTRPLLMGLIDGELIPEEAAEVNQALIRSQALRDEYERLRETSQRLEAISMLDTLLKRLSRQKIQRCGTGPTKFFSRIVILWFVFFCARVSSCLASIVSYRN